MTEKKVIRPDNYYLKGKVKYTRVREPQKGGQVKEDDGTVKQMPDSLGVTLIIDDNNRDEVLDAVEQFKLSQKPKRDKERDEVMPFRRNVEYGPEGQILNPLQFVVDANGDPIPPNVLIGNGSYCTIAYRLQQYSTQFGKRNKAVLVGLQVHELVPYEKPVIEETNPFKRKEGSTTGNPF